MAKQLNYDESVKRYRRMVELREIGATYSEIAEIYGITRQAVFLRLKKGLPRRASYEKGILGKSGLGHLKGRERARMLVRIRDNFTCQDCGDVRTYDEVSSKNAHSPSLKGKIKLFDVHHTNGMCGKKSRSYDATDDLSGMITLCHKCHYNRPEHRVQDASFGEAVSNGHRKA